MLVYRDARFAGGLVWARARVAAVAGLLVQEG